jgi:hypothetical protein
LNDDFRGVLSDTFRSKDDPFVQSVFAPLEGKPIKMPERFAPDLVFIRRHRAEIFIDAAK